MKYVDQMDLIFLHRNRQTRIILMIDMVEFISCWVIVIFQSKITQEKSQNTKSV